MDVGEWQLNEGRGRHLTEAASEEVPKSLKGIKMEEKNKRKSTYIVIIIIIIGILSLYSLYRITFPRLESVRIELDYDHGFYLNFNKFNLSEDAIDNISISNFIIIVDFPEFNKNITYSFTPEFTNINHIIESDQGSIFINNVDNYETFKKYPFNIHFQIESNNSELNNLILLRDTNTIYGEVRFDPGSIDVDFFDGEYIRQNEDTRFLEFEYPPNDLKCQFIVTKYIE